MIGSVVGARYRIVSLLGQGAMGQVYLAEHLHLGRKEALKVLKPTIAVDPQFVSRFRREARATNRVQHINIIAVYDFGRLPDGRLFLAMEYADGPDLEQLLVAEGRLHPARAVHVTKQLARAIRHAHDHGVVHRDIKPSNLVLTEHRGAPDFLKVLDFGMAKILAPDDGDPLVVTLKGQTFGTPAYMAPEQFREPTADPRVDIYATGCVLYQMLTGQPPFTGHSLELMHLHEKEPPAPPSSRTPEAEIPAELDDLVMHCLEKDPDKRFQTGKALLAGLSAIPVLGKPASKRSTFKGVAVPKPELDEFEIDTDVTGGSAAMRAVSGDELESADTEKLTASALRASYRASLLEVAEAMRDRGCEAVVQTLGQLHGLRFEERELENETSWIEERLASIDRRIQERESSLRFALGELRFDREQAGPDLRVDIDYQVGQLEQRLDHLRDESREELDMLHDRGIHLATRRASLEEALGQAYERLRDAVDRALPDYEDDPALGSVIESYENATTTYEALEL